MSYNDANGTTLEISGLPAILADGFVGDCKSVDKVFDAYFSAVSGNFIANKVLVTCDYSHDVSAGTDCQ
jgi:hypothetical protein